MGLYSKPSGSGGRDGRIGSSSIVDNHGYQVWHDALLAHPGERTMGGEPCVGYLGQCH